MAYEPVVTHAGGHRVYVEHHRAEDPLGTVILVNGALSTTRSFGATARYLTRHFDVVLYDLPYAGQSKALNPAAPLIAKEDEVEILLGLIDQFQATALISISWGGVAALLSLARSPKSIRRAIIGSFSPLLNQAMRCYVARLYEYIEAGDIGGGADLVNGTVGEYLPRAVKRLNRSYLTALATEQCAQVSLHIGQMVSLDAEHYLRRLRAVEVPVLFLNGDRDQYTTASDSAVMASYLPDCRFSTIPGAGHFLDMEGAEVRAQVQQTVLSFLLEDAVAGAVSAAEAAQVGCG